MSTTPENLKYTDSHEWVRQEADGLVITAPAEMPFATAIAFKIE